MAYGLKYTISQILRDETLLVVNISEKAYVGSTITTYDAVSITLEPNSSTDEPTSTILSSQLNVSFIIPSDADASSFPDLLSFDDRKYYVELKQIGLTTKLLWAGFLFNDYVNVPFTTGNNQIDIVAIDGLSFLRYKNYELIGTESQNNIVKLLDFIQQAIESINFPNILQLKVVCSYFAEGMVNRGANTANEPFSQTYQYIRDYLGLDYYTVLENIISSFGCRMFQANGKWNIMAINEMASDRYFTNYDLSVHGVQTVVSSGLDTATTLIKEYDVNNVYFIDNSQTKVSRKGYPKLIVATKFDYVPNYCHNGTFKQTTGSGITLAPVGFIMSHTGVGGHATLTDVPNDQFNVVELWAGNSSYGTSILQSGLVLPATDYLPFMYSPSVNVSFNLITQEYKAKVQIILRLSIGTIYYWNDTTQLWQLTSVYMDTPANIFEWSSFSKTVDTSQLLGVYPFNSSIGYISVKIMVSDATYNFIQIKNVQVTQSAADITALEVTRKIGVESSITKVMDQPYGNTFGNTVGVLTNYNEVKLVNWYRYGKTGTYDLLINLIARQMSNLLNKNFGTLEGSLGSFENSGDMLYLDKTYMVQDSLTDALSYNGRKFLSNRMSITPQSDQIDSFQLIEITNTDNASTESIEYIGDLALIRPRRYF